MAGTDTITTTYSVEGMSCEHCVRAVTTEVKGVPGVTDVDVDLTDGTVRVTSTAALDDAAVAAAIDEAGYELRT
jgi:copper chaperone